LYNLLYLKTAAKILLSDVNTKELNKKLHYVSISPQGRRGKPPSGAQSHYAIRLADQSKVSPGLRDGTV